MKTLFQIRRKIKEMRSLVVLMKSRTDSIYFEYLLFEERLRKTIASLLKNVGLIADSEKSFLSTLPDYVREVGDDFYARLERAALVRNDALRLREAYSAAEKDMRELERIREEFLYLVPQSVKFKKIKGMFERRISSLTSEYRKKSEKKANEQSLANFISISFLD